MERFGGLGGGGDTQQLIDPRDPNHQLGSNSNSTGADVFDASQYAFFGNEVLEEVELGGLEDEEEDFPVAKLEDDEYQLEQEEILQGVYPGIDDLTTTFSKLNKNVMGPSVGDFGDRGSRENSSAVEFERGGSRDFTNWVDQQDIFDSESGQWSNSSFRLQDLNRTSSYSEPHQRQNIPQHHLLVNEFSNHLHRTSSYPDQQQQQSQHLGQHLHFSSEPVPVPKSSFISYPPPGGGGSPQQPSPNLLRHLNSPQPPFQGGSHQMPPLPQTFSNISNPQLQMSGISQFGGNLPFRPPPPNVNNRLQNQYIEQQPDLSNGIFAHNNKQHRIHPQPQFQPPFNHHFNHHHLSPPPPLMMNNFEAQRRNNSLPRGGASFGSIRPIQGQGPSQGHRYFDTTGWPQFKSKYMTPEEIENILRMQLAATHSTDPYVDDYYHQACLFNKSNGGKLRHHFCPNNLRECAPRSRVTANEPHAFLQVDALGRVSFSSIRRPRPLLEVDPPKTNNNEKTEEMKKTEKDKPLEQEPMLAARVTIEDGICLLLDVDDIDRFLQFNPQLQDNNNGGQLRQRRQVLLEGLATSLHLVDPLGKNGETVELNQKDDLVFLRLSSLPKGRKLLSKFLQHLSPNSDLTRIVCMAIFRHLRFLFGNLPEDSGTTEKLVKTVAESVSGMELRALGACLASVVCSMEHPPLRPIGTGSGDGASVLLKAVLDRGTEQLTDPRAVNSNVNRAFWQASFDAFFVMLTKYCFGKYDSVVQTLVMNGADVGLIGSDVAKAISREMPVELLRASLPHTNESQRKLLLDFAQRSMPNGGS